MTTTVIELNDTAITAYNDNHPLLRSPGYALVDNTVLQVGEAAYRRARLHPSHINNRFWQRLSLDPLPKPTPKARHYADIAYAHLHHTWKQIEANTKEVVFAVPGTFDSHKLGLLLGIAQECALPVRGLVDAALVVSSVTPAITPTRLHLDLELHRIVLTQLFQDVHLKRIGVKAMLTTGMASLWELWAHAVAAAFVRRTRFDPLHSGQAEQRLYDQLAEKLSELRPGGHAHLELHDSRGKGYAVTLDYDWFAQKAAGCYQRIVKFVGDYAPAGGPPSTLQLSHRLVALPGFVDCLSQLRGLEIVPLGSRLIAQGTLQQRQHIIAAPGEPLRFVTQLPLHYAPAAVPELSVPTAAGQRPTHVLYRSRAYPLTEQPLSVGTTIPESARGIHLSGPLQGIAPCHCSLYLSGNRIWLDNHSADGTFLNGNPIASGATLQTGDRIRIGAADQQLELIAVLQGHEP